MNLKVTVTNKTVLSDGRRTPIITPFYKTPEELIAEMEKTTPVPVFRTGNKILTKEFLESLIDTKAKSEKELKLALENKDDLEDKKEELKVDEKKEELNDELNVDSPVENSEDKKEEELKPEESNNDTDPAKVESSNKTEGNNKQQFGKNKFQNNNKQTNQQ